MSIDLTGKVAVITGASRGIGEAIALRYAQAGAKVVVASRKQAGVDAAAARIREAGGEATAVACHTGDPDAVEAMFDEATAAFGPVDVVVNNAATNPYFGPMLGVEWPAWDKTFDVNVKGYFACARALAQRCMDRGAPGAVVNVSSILGLRAARMQGVYGMTKAAVISMTKTLALEWGPSQIRVNAIAPGFIDTKFSAALTGNDQIKNMILARTPIGRIGEPEDMCDLALYLGSDAAGFVTGQIVDVDGGRSILDPLDLPAL